jgi:hypothetical protein
MDWNCSNEGVWVSAWGTGISGTNGDYTGKRVVRGEEIHEWGEVSQTNIGGTPMPRFDTFSQESYDEERFRCTEAVQAGACYGQ